MQVSTRSARLRIGGGSLGQLLFSRSCPAGPARFSKGTRCQGTAPSAPPWRPPTILDGWVQKEARPISLKQLTFFGRTITKDRLLSSANYVREELPTRIAHRLRDMQTLPYVVVSNSHISHVYERYYKAFETFRKIPPVMTLEDNDKFCESVSQMLQEHLTVIPNLAKGVLEASVYMKPEDTDRFMNRLLRARISRRVIAEQHIALTETFKKHGKKVSSVAREGEGDGDFVGEVFLKCNAKEVVEKCAIVVSSIMKKAYGPSARIPKVNIKGHLDATFPYILSHLEYIIGELLRNSIQATAERFVGRDEEAPPIEVLICEAPQFVIFRISDQGGGIDQDLLPSLWSFSKGPRRQARIENLSQVSKMEATMQELDRPAPAAPETPEAEHASTFTSTDLDARASSLTDLASRPPDLRLGIGLPMGRVYAEYWAGSLSLQSLAGYGTDVFLHISKLGNKNEQLTTRASMDAI